MLEFPCSKLYLKLQTAAAMRVFPDISLCFDIKPVSSQYGRRFFVFNTTKRRIPLKQKLKTLQKDDRQPQKRAGPGQKLYALFLTVCLLSMSTVPVFAADTIWTKASEIMKDVYSQVLAISTIAAVVTAAIALLLMNFSKNERNVQESRAGLKRIIITWAILNSLGFIMGYVTPFFSGGQWTA